VALLRAEAGRDPTTAPSDLIGELSTRSEEIRVRWAAHDVRLHRTGVKHFHHPLVGDLTLSFEGLELPADPDSSSSRTRRSRTRRHTTRSTSSPAEPRRPTTRESPVPAEEKPELRAILQPEVDHNDATLGVQPGQLSAVRFNYRANAGSPRHRVEPSGRANDQGGGCVRWLPDSPHNHGSRIPGSFVGLNRRL
jgi:hypothetical protein